MLDRHISKKAIEKLISESRGDNVSMFAFCILLQEQTNTEYTIVPVEFLKYAKKIIHQRIDEKKILKMVTLDNKHLFEFLKLTICVSNFISINIILIQKWHLYK